MNSDFRELERKFILILWEEGYKPNRIQELLEQKEIHYSVSQIYRIIQQFKETHNIKLKYFENDNAQKMDEEFEERIKEALLENQNLSLKGLQNDQTINPDSLSKEAIRLMIHSLGFQSYKLGKSLYSNEKIQEDRYLFAKKHLKWSQQWKQVCFTDECFFSIESIGETYGWVLQKEDLDYSQAKTKVTFSKMTSKIWAMIGSEGPLAIVMLNENVNSKLIIEIYEENVIPLFKDTDKILQFDNAKAHTASQVTSYLKEKNIEYLEFPPYSPDISIIENIFSIIKQELKEVVEAIKTEDQFFAFIQTIFFTSPLVKQGIMNAYKNYHQKIQALYKNKGKENL